MDFGTSTKKIHIWDERKNKKVKGILCPDSTLYFTFCGLCSVDIGTLGHTYKPPKEEDGNYHPVYCKKCLKAYLKLNSENISPPKAKAMGIRNGRVI